MHWATNRSPRDATNNRSLQERFIGSWKLVSYQARCVEDDSVVVHQPEVSLFPNWVGQTQSHTAALVDRRLELTTTTPVQYGHQQLTAVLVRERAHS
jgi:hypothetical protein